MKGERGDFLEHVRHWNLVIRLLHSADKARERTRYWLLMEYLHDADEGRNIFPPRGPESRARLLAEFVDYWTCHVFLLARWVASPIIGPMWCRTGGAQSTGRHEALWPPIQRMVAGMDGNRTTQDALTGALSQPCQQDNWATVPRSSETQKRSAPAGAPQALANGSPPSSVSAWRTSPRWRTRCQRRAHHRRRGRRVLAGWCTSRRS